MRILAFILMLVSTPVTAQTITDMPCRPIIAGEAMMAMNGFTLRSGGVDGDGERIELWIDGNDRFAIMLRRPALDSLCLVLGGDGWTKLIPGRGA